MIIDNIEIQKYNNYNTVTSELLLTQPINTTLDFENDQNHNYIII